MNCKTRIELKKLCDKTSDKVFDLTFAHRNNVDFITELWALCRSAENYSYTCCHLENLDEDSNYEVKQSYEDDVLKDSLFFYSSFLDFVNKYNLGGNK